MTLEELDLRLRHLSRDVEHSGEALLALELDQTRALLDKAALTGATAVAWAPAAAALVHAWEAQALLAWRRCTLKHSASCTPLRPT
jgi:hypothetical protein